MLLAAIGLPFAAAVLVPALYRLVGERVAYVGAAVAAGSLALVFSQFDATGSVVVDWIPAYGIALRLYVDGLSLLVALLASGVGVLVFTYCGGYMHGKDAQPRFYASLLAFMGSMLGLVFAADLIALFVFWELTSLTSFSLIGHYSTSEDAVYAARKSMLITVAGGLFLLAGLIALYSVSGDALGARTFDLVAMLEEGEAMRAALRDRGLFLPVLGLVGVGAAAKSAQVPLHVWLPDAMEAPTPVSAFLHSATMVKAGVYLFGRMRPLLRSPEWEASLLALGLTTMTVGALLAVAADDVKALLAYSTASHLGLITAGFGFQSKLGAETGAFHVLNHAVFKAALFLVAGIVAHEAGSQLLSELGGLRRDLPLTAGVAGLAAVSMAGLPPLNGFHSKELLFEAAYEFAAHDGGLAWAVPVVAVGASAFTVLYSYRFLTLFLGERRAPHLDDRAALEHDGDDDGDERGADDGHGHGHSGGHGHADGISRPPLPMLVGPVVLAVAAVVVGLRPGLATGGVVGRAFEAAQFAPGATPGEGFSVAFPTELKPAVVMSAVTVGVGAAMVPVERRVRDAVRAVLARDPATADFYYDGAVDGLADLSGAVVARVQTGRLRTYATWILGGFAVLALAGHAAADPDLALELGDGVTVATVLVSLLAVLSAAAVVRAASHVAGVLVLSVVGLMIAVFYILAAAPDLALTQLLVETLLLVLFLLVIKRLPPFYGEIDRLRAARDGVLSLLVGAAVFVTVLASTAPTPDPFLRRRLLELAGFGGEEPVGFVTELGGGANVVNVVLVDFRATDTLGEISVVAMVAISVVTLLRMRDVGGAVFPADVAPSGDGTAPDGGRAEGEGDDATDGPESHDGGVDG
ncbi:Na+/H+ antiporter subunit A [Halobacteriales archaeon SW_5_70_135]|nr:MAG: Na+/H+ antiporter subunit A [Halobacteriales archaeon SW_5_70_135]